MNPAAGATHSLSRPDCPINLSKKRWTSVNGAIPEPFILLAIDPTLRGAYVWGTRADPAFWPIGTLARGLTGRMPLRLPPATTPELLAPRLDVMATLTCRRPVHRPGLVQRAAGGAIVIDAADLIPTPAAAALASQLAQTVSRKRPILFARSDARPLPSDPLAAFCGLWIAVDAMASSDLAKAAVLAQERQDEGVLAGISVDWDALRARILAARRLAATISLTASLAEQICRRVAAAGVRDHTLDFFAARACLARAAWHGRSAVEEDDIEAALRWVVYPRVGATPADATDLALSADQAQSLSLPSQQAAAPRGHGGDGLGVREDQTENTAPGAEGTSVPESNDNLTAVGQPGPNRGHPPAQGSSPAGTGAAGDPPVIVVPPAALPSVLPLAATANPLRPGRPTSPGRHDGRPEARVTARRYDGPPAIVPSVLAALPWQAVRTALPASTVRVLPEDLRWRRRRPRPRTLYVLAVDGSGSMVQGRMQLAKGAAIQVLAGAYRERRYVALIDFRHRTARLVCPPGRSSALIRRHITALPSGGGTPLPAALALAARLVQRWRLRHPDGRTALILFTDGKANVPLSGAHRTGETSGDHRARAWAETMQLADRLRAMDVRCVLVDVGPPGTEGPLKQLAHRLAATIVRIAAVRR